MIYDNTVCYLSPVNITTTGELPSFQPLIVMPKVYPPQNPEQMKVTNCELKQIKIPGRLHPLPVFFGQRPAMLGTSFDETKGQTRARVQAPSFQ